MSRNIVFVLFWLTLNSGVSILARDFETEVTNALSHRANLIETDFTNYVSRCVNQTTNVELSLSARVVLVRAQLEMFGATMNESWLAAACQTVTNALAHPLLTTDKWQYWHLQLLHVACMNTNNDRQEAYMASARAWQKIQGVGFVDSTNVVSRALLRFENFGDDATIKEAIAVAKILSSNEVGKPSEAEDAMPFLSVRLKREVEEFLGK